MDSMRRINAYVKLNFQRCLYQGKTLVICLCIAVFFFIYFGNVRGNLLAFDQKLGVFELFLSAVSNIYTAFTIWAGFVLLICDVPYREEGVYQYLLRSSRKSWLWGQIIYVIGITVLYFFYIFVVILVLIIPQVQFRNDWSRTFIRLIDIPKSYGIEYLFSFSMSVIRSTTAGAMFAKSIVLAVMNGIAVGMLTMMMHLIWPEGPGVFVGGCGLIVDFWATAVQLMQKQLLYISPMSMTRVVNLSSNSFNRVNPTFGYACTFIGALIIIPLAAMHLLVGRYDYQ